MLSVEDIHTLVTGGEGYNVDFKRSVPSKVGSTGILEHKGRKSDGEWIVTI